MKYYRIWKETYIPAASDEDTTLIVSEVFMKTKYSDLDSAIRSLKDLADRKFDYSKYKLKNLEDIVKIDDREYHSFVWNSDKLIKEKYYIQ